MEDMFRQMKAICPRCKSWEYCRFRFLNNKRRCKKLQPRYICTRCDKYFTLGGKLYNASLNSSSKARILTKRPCPGEAAVASAHCMNGDAYAVNGLHAQSFSDNCCMLKTVMAGDCNTFQRANGEVYCCETKLPALRLPSHGKDFCVYPGIRNPCCRNMENPCSITINAGGCNGNQGIWRQHDGGLSQIYGTACFPPYYCPSAAELVPSTSLQNFQEDVMAGNEGFNYCLNNIPPLNNIEPMELFEKSQEGDLDVGLLLSESFSERAANAGISVSGGEEGQEEEIAHNTGANLLGKEDMEFHAKSDNVCSAGSYEQLDEENEWLKDFVNAQGEEGKSSANGVDSCLELNLYDFDSPFDSGFDAHQVGGFQGDFNNVDDIENCWMF